MSPAVQGTLGKARSLVSGFTPGQRGVVLVAGLALVLGAVGLSRWVAQPAWTPLYGNLSGTDASAIVERLRSDGVPYKLADGGGTVLVPQAQVYDVRVALSGEGLPSGEAEGGYALLDKQGITATDFQQNVAYRRALEGELSRTLQAMDGVRTAVVHLALPKKDVFATEQDKPTASVLIALRPGRRLEGSQVQAITHLVGSSVEGLAPEQVTVTDSAGNLLSRPGGDGGPATSAAAAEADQATARYEDRLSGAVQQMLDRVLGTGRSVVRVNADLDYDRTDTTSERYVYPTEIPPVSESTAEETYQGAGGGVGGVLGRTYPDLGPAAGGTGDGGQYSKKQRTVNNSVDKIVQRSQAAPGTVRRLTVAVVLDARAAGTVNPAQVEQLVANAVGIDLERGDSVQVDRIPFDTSAAEQAQKDLAAADAKAKTQGYIDLGEKAGLALLGLILLVIALRRRKRRPRVEATAHDLPELGQGLLMAPPQPAAIAAPVAAHAELPAADPAQLEREHLREHISELVENQPEEVAQVIQGWLAERKS